MNAWSDRSYPRACGQTTVLGLVLVLVSAATVVLLYNTGQTASEKSRLVNAADAAAYSGAVYAARNLNFMAYTNRAMIANHVAVGHFISYVSWVRYVKDTSGRLGRLTSWIPYVNVATRAVARWGDYVRQGTEAVAKVYVPASNMLNRVLYRAQWAAKAGMMATTAVGPLYRVMERTAREYAAPIRVNAPADMGSLSGAISGATIVNEMWAIYNFSQSYDASDDAGRINRMVSASLGSSRRFISGSRGWNLNLLLVKIDKQGSTSHSMNGRLADWRARDKLSFSWWTRKGWKKSTLGKGRATAREFDKDYSGVPGYYDLATVGDKRDHSLRVTAYATMPIAEARIKALLGMRTSAKRIAALARAEVYFKRPDVGFTKVGKGEYANLYNPFWDAHLIKVPY